MSLNHDDSMKDFSEVKKVLIVLIFILGFVGIVGVRLITCGYKDQLMLLLKF